MSALAYKISLPPLNRPEKSDVCPPAKGYNVAVRLGSKRRVVLTKLPGRQGVVTQEISRKMSASEATKLVNTALSAQISELSCVKVEHMAEFMAGEREDLPVCYRKK